MKEIEGKPISIDSTYMQTCNMDGEHPVFGMRTTEFRNYLFDRRFISLVIDNSISSLVCIKALFTFYFYRALGEKGTSKSCLHTCLCCCYVYSNTVYNIRVLYRSRGPSLEKDAAGNTTKRRSKVRSNST